MLVRHLHVEDLKLLRDLRLDFVRSDGSTRMWTVLVGENGLGKTSVLRALALAAVGPERGSQLADVAALPDRRRPTAHVRIQAEFRVHAGLEARAIESTVELPSDVNLFRGTSRWLDETNANPFLPSPLGAAQAQRNPAAEWFVAGYGVDRKLPQPLNAAEVSDRLLSRLEPLFDRGPIVATGFADQLEPTLARSYARLLQEALIDHDLLPSVTKLYLGGRGGVTRSKTLVEANRFTLRVGGSRVAMPANWLSQGYQAMVAWVADLIGHIVLTHNAAVPLNEMQGLVLIDELDLFVHPRWQIELIPKLKRIFPKMQFVVSTHSPMVLPGLDREEVFILGQDDRGNIVAEQASSSPKLLTGSEIYDLFFGIHELYPTEAARALRTFALLAADPDRTDAEQHELEEAEAVLRREGVPPDVPAVSRGAGT